VFAASLIRTGVRAIFVDLFLGSNCNLSKLISGYSDIVGELRWLQLRVARGCSGYTSNTSSKV